MRNLIFILIAFIAAVTFIRTFDQEEGGVSRASITINADN
jgi:hypothetical protein